MEDKIIRASVDGDVSAHSVVDLVCSGKYLSLKGPRIMHPPVMNSIRCVARVDRSAAIASRRQMLSHLHKIDSLVKTRFEEVPAI